MPTLEYFHEALEFLGKDYNLPKLTKEYIENGKSLLLHKLKLKPLQQR